MRQSKSAHASAIRRVFSSYSSDSPCADLSLYQAGVNADPLRRGELWTGDRPLIDPVSCDHRWRRIETSREDFSLGYDECSRCGLAEHDWQPERRCKWADCDLMREPDEDFCAYHDEAASRTSRSMRKSDVLPMTARPNGQWGWDGFHLTPAPAHFSSPEYQERVYARHLTSQARWQASRKFILAKSQRRQMRDALARALMIDGLSTKSAAVQFGVSVGVAHYVLKQVAPQEPAKRREASYVAKRPSTKWGPLFEKLVRDKQVTVSVPSGVNPQDHRGRLRSMLTHGSRLTYLDKWSTRIVGRKIFVQHIGTWAEVDGRDLGLTG